MDCFAAVTSTELPLSGMDNKALRSAEMDELADDPP